MKTIWVLFISILIYSSCSKDPLKPTAEIPVESVSLFSRVFHYTNSNQKDSVSYTTSRDSVRAIATITSTGQFSLAIDMPFNKGRDYIKFIIDQPKLKPGYVGVYELKPVQPGGYQGDAQNIYGYRRDQYSYTELGIGNATGEFVITGYNAQKKLIEGRYHLNIHSFHDPMVGMNWHETNIIISGEFEKVLVP